ncbi:uncharacterized protein LOC142639702 [Castanea sativa]|uniref:uncharacterized protein LOC142639702 n=1 Tax=Castanea sativa TaxID=21020 RepID=UPI003F65279D
MATDANNKIYPLVFAVVESESTETWGWFLACIRSWRNDNVVVPPTHGSSNFVPYNPPLKKSLEDTLQQFMQTQSTINNQNSQDLNDIRSTLTKLTTSMSKIEKGKFPSQPEPNPQGQFCVDDCSSSKNKVSQAKSVTTLRGGKIIEKDIPKSNTHDESSKIKSSDEVLEPKSNEIERCPIPTPFPQRLMSPQKVNQNFEILEVLEQVKVIIPLLDAIKQISSYAKCLKDLCTVKRKLNVHKKAFFTEPVSAIIQNNRPPKFKDPGCPTISCVIGNSRIEKALLDLGESVNLLPFSVYEQLGLGELKPTSIILQLVDRCMIVPKGVVEDVLLPPREIKLLPSSEQVPKLELKSLPVELKYAFLGTDETFPVVISSKLDSLQEIYLEDNAKPSRETQRRLNPTMKEVVRTEVLKLLDVGIIYPIAYSKWVSPAQVVPKKFGITVIKNEKNELIPTRVTTGWRMCIDYRKLNAVTRKDHFPLPFLDKVLERVKGHKYYCFLDGYSGYYQIEIALEDQKKTTFTCPFGTFAFRRMPFGLCNAPATFQRCMLSIFSDMVEHYLEVFMDDFSVFSDSSDECLSNLQKVLTKC